MVGKRSIGGMVAGVVLLAVAGCVSSPLEEDKEYSPTLMVTQNSDGEVMLAWDTKPGYRYRLYAIDRGDAEWKEVGRTWDGTGKRISITAQVPPRKKDRRYWIQADKIEP